MESNLRNQNIQYKSLLCSEGGEYEMEGGDDEAVGQEDIEEEEEALIEADTLLETDTLQ